MTSLKQMQLEHAVLQERFSELEEECAAAERRVTESSARPRAERARPAEMSTTSSADMYTHLANSSDWSARQMGAIEGGWFHVSPFAFTSACACASACFLKSPAN